MEEKKNQGPETKQVMPNEIHKYVNGVEEA